MGTSGEATLATVSREYHEPRESSKRAIVSAVWHYETTSTLTTAASGAAVGGSGLRSAWNVWGLAEVTSWEAAGDREWRHHVFRPPPIYSSLLVQLADVACNSLTWRLV